MAKARVGLNQEEQLNFFVEAGVRRGYNTDAGGKCC